MLTGCLPGPCSLQAVHKMQESSASFSSSLCRKVCVCHHLFSDTLSTLYMYCVSRSSWFLYICASFEMDLIWIFMVVFSSLPVTIPASTCMRCVGLVCGFTVWWGNYHMSLNTWMCFTSHICDVGCLFILCVFLYEAERDAALPDMLIAVCCSFRHPTGGVCINAVICKWHAFEWVVWCRLLDYCTNTNHKDLFFVQMHWLSEQLQKKQHIRDAGIVFVVRWGDFCISYKLRWMWSTSISHYHWQTWTRLPFPHFARICQLLILSIPAAHWGVSVGLEIKSKCVMMFAVILALRLWCVAVYHMGQRIGEQFSSPGSQESLQR